MNLRRASPYLLGGFAIIAAVGLYLTNRGALNRRLYEQIVTAGLRDDRHHGALQAYVKVRKAMDARPLCLDPPFRDDCVNILVVRIDHQSTGIQVNSLPSLSHDIRLNAIALPPNLIVVDAKLLDFMIVNVFNAFIATVNRVSLDGPGPETVKTALAQASFLQFGNLAKFFDRSAYTNAATIEENADKVLKLYAAREGDQPIEQIMDVGRSYISTVYALLMEHEIAHLETEHVPHFALGVNAILKQSATIVLREEQRADAVALSHVSRITELLRSRQLPDIQAFVHDRLTNSLPYLSYADLLDDLALYDGLEGFRRVHAKDLALSLFHERCRPELDIREPSSDPVELLERYFNAQDRVVMAERKSLPLLTQDEFAQLRSKLAHADLAQTHEHNLLRSEAIRKTLGGSDVDQIQRPRQEDYIRALLDDKPTQAFSDRSGFTAIPGTNIDRLLEGARPIVELRPAVTCPLERCYVGLAPNNDGFIEIVGTSSEVSRIRLVYNLHPRWAVPINEANESVAGEDQHYVDNMVKMLNLFALFREGANNARDTILMAAFLRDPIFRCGIGTQRVKKDGILYLSQSLSQPGWIEITVSAAE